MTWLGTMTGRLVAAQLFRIRWQLMLLAFMTAGYASSPADTPGFMVRLKAALPLLMSFTTINMLGFFWSRDVRILPIPRRVALRCAWISAAALPIVIMCGRLLGAWIFHALDAAGAPSGEAIIIAAVWDATYIGISLTLLQRETTPFAGAREGSATVHTAATLLGTVCWLAVPFFRPELAPSSVAELSWWYLLGLVVGIAIAAFPLLEDPDQWPRLGVLFDAPRNTASRPIQPVTPRRLDQLTGMRRLLPAPVGTAALVAILTLGAGTALIVSREGAKSPFSSAVQDMPFLMIGGPLFLLLLAPFGWASGVTPFLRPLKTLPVSTMQIVVTMTVVPMMMPVFFWVLAAGVHLAVGAPSETTWRLGTFALLCGVMSFSGAVYARFNSLVVILAGGVGPLIGVLMLMLVDKAAIEQAIALWFPVIGLIGVPAAFLLNYRTVTRGSSSSAAYRGLPGASLYRGGQP